MTTSTQRIIFIFIIDAAYPTFTHKFGVADENGFRVIPERWEKGISAATTVGITIGLLVSFNSL